MDLFQQAVKAKYQNSDNQSSFQNEHQRIGFKNIKATISPDQPEINEKK